MTRKSVLMNRNAGRNHATVLQILEGIRLLGWELYDGEPDNIVYDRLTGTVSITCIAYGADKPTNRPTTERDGFLRILGQN
ncbi:hypothetical protein AFLA_000381 [Aspergillus flavus NRRL3357]|nr:hypothetical protein AFLA_000381 [Aspergillus flavus NRRL3357]